MTKGKKAAETRKKKQQAALEEMGYERKKVKPKRARKPMTPEQKKAAAERLAKAREARGHTGAKSVHESIRDLPEDHPIHWSKVKQWIKDSEMSLKQMKSFKDSSVASERSAYQDLDVYIKNMKSYLTTGHWADFRFGENRENRVNQSCVAMAYWPDGEPKRTIGVFYPDIMKVWDEELEEAWYGKDHNKSSRIPTTRELYDEEEVLEDGGRDSDENTDELYRFNRTSV